MNHILITTTTKKLDNHNIKQNKRQDNKMYTKYNAYVHTSNIECRIFIYGCGWKSESKEEKYHDWHQHPSTKYIKNIE